MNICPFKSLGYCFYKKTCEFQVYDFQNQTILCGKAEEISYELRSSDTKYQCNESIQDRT